MRLNNENLYMVFNTSTKASDEWVELNEPAKQYLFMNPMNSEIKKAENRGNLIHIQLESEESVFIKCSGNSENVSPFVYENVQLESEEIGALWQVKFLEGGPVYPGNLQIDELQSWTKMGNDETQRFAGTVQYTTEFLHNKDSNLGVLNLGIIKDCARIKLNGKDYGSLLGPTFKLKVDNLVSGVNKLQIEVTNVAANRIRDLDLRGVEWRNFYDINFVNIEYQPFDSSGWEIREAGLLGPVTLTSF